MAGIKDVALAAGVSTATVSRALRGLPNVSEKTRETIQRFADELGYVPSSSASGLASGRTLALAVVVPGVSGWFYASVLEGVDAELRAAGYDMVLFNLGGGSGERERVFHSSILRKRGDAVVALCIDFTEDEREQLASIGLPSIIVGGPVKGLRYVGIDEVDAARRATQHLIDLGHRDILYIGGGAEEGMGLNSRVPLDRRRGYEEALRAAHVDFDEERSLLGEFSTGVTRQAMNDFLDSSDVTPTAVFAASDEMAMGAMLAIYDHGLSVPGDISVIGIDDHDLSESFGLTTMAQDPYAQGSIGARILLDELDGKPSKKKSTKLPVTLIERSSTAAARAQPVVEGTLIPLIGSARPGVGPRVEQSEEGSHRRNQAQVDRVGSELGAESEEAGVSAIADVARAAGVSKATASRALSGNGYVAPQTRVRVEAAAAEIGYVASPNAAGLVTGHTKNVGVVVPFVNRWFFGEVLDGIEHSLLDRGYDMTLYNLAVDAQGRDRIFDFFLARKRFDAVIAIGVEPSAVEIDALQKLDMPVVGIGGPVSGLASIAIDDEAAARLATEHLISLGHTDIAHITGPKALKSPGTVHGKRLRGFQQAMRAAGLDPTDREWATEMTMPGGYAAARRLLGDPRRRPTAIFAACDEIAIGAIVASREFGIAVPTELSVVGIDGHEYAEMFALTTLEQQPREQGRKAVEVLISVLEDSGKTTLPPATELPFRLVVRSSTTAPHHTYSI
jgi:DNA-binding LacI/PurR family transcriptional regulator